MSALARRSTSKREPSVTSITMRIPSTMRDLIDSAAASLGKTRTEFVLESARIQAVDVLLNRRVFNLDEEAGEAFAALLAEPLAPGQALVDLMSRKAPWE